MSKKLFIITAIAFTLSASFASRAVAGAQSTTPVSAKKCEARNDNIKRGFAGYIIPSQSQIKKSNSSGARSARSAQG